MRLVEEGRLSLSDPVAKYLPEYETVTVREADGSVRPPKTVMTVEHLFTMSAGLDYNSHRPAFRKAMEQGGGTRDLAVALAKDPLLFDPGTRYQYSFCHDVLAAVAEVVSGMRFSEYLETALFRPLGIKNMGFIPTAEQEKKFSAMYSYREGCATPISIPISNSFRFTPSFEGGGAGLFGSVDEYMKIITPIACGGTAENGYRILKPETVKLFTENRLSDIQRDDLVSTTRYGYGFGLCGRVHVDPTLSLCLSPVGEFGWSSASSHHVLIDTKNRLAFHYATHMIDCKYAHNKIHPALRNLVYEGLNR
jgi:CubicO group peptidase (beta-lactamase class C family)